MRQNHRTCALWHFPQSRPLYPSHGKYATPCAWALVSFGGPILSSIILSILGFVAPSIVIYLVIAFTAILVGKPVKQAQEGSDISFKALRLDYSQMPKLEAFATRDGKQLAYRRYPSQSEKILILLHGSGWHSQYFYPLADFLSSRNLCRVFTPDLRGHGQCPERRGDIDYIGQFEDDIADLILTIRRNNPGATMVVGGHSSGGGLAVRFAGSRFGSMADAYLLLAPYLKYNAPTIRRNSGGWARPNIGRIVGLSMLNNIGVRWLNSMRVIDFDMPIDYRNGSETLSYSFRLNTNFAPRDYRKSLKATTRPILLVSGVEDEVMHSSAFEPEISRYAAARVELLRGVSHMGVVVGAEVRPVVEDWLRGL